MKNYSPNQKQSLDEILDKCGGHIIRIAWDNGQRKWILTGWLRTPSEKVQLTGDSIRHAVNNFLARLTNTSDSH